MKVFISWSGDRSKAVAEALRSWLPVVLQPVRPWLSGYDIEAGSRWSSEMALQLEEARFGILCLTPENLDAPWVMFEAGALSKKLDGSRVCPYLFGFEPRELTGPLVQFQAARADRNDTKRLLMAMNHALGETRLPESVLDRAFDKWWPDLEASLARVPGSPDTQDRARVPTPERHARPSRRVFDPRKSGPALEKFVKVLIGTPDMTSTKAPSKADRLQYVFIVHGHAHGQMEQVARFIEKLGANAIVLHEQPSEGLTVIEKLEAYSDVGFAVVIMTGDDIGTGASTSPGALHRRARQNVVLELGYFLAKLGRTRVCVLYEDEVEIPSDYAGVLYIPLDRQGAWRLALARELKVAGMPIDLNRAF